MRGVTREYEEIPKSSEIEIGHFLAKSSFKTTAFEAKNDFCQKDAMLTLPWSFLQAILILTFCGSPNTKIIENKKAPISLEFRLN